MRVFTCLEQLFRNKSLVKNCEEFLDRTNSMINANMEEELFELFSHKLGCKERGRCRKRCLLQSKSNSIKAQNQQTS